MLRCACPLRVDLRAGLRQGSGTAARSGRPCFLPDSKAAPPGAASSFVRWGSAMTYDLPDEIKVECEGGLRLITLNRPESRNAGSSTMLFALTSLAERLAQDGEAS